MTTDPNCGHHESCACLRPGDNECNCHKAYGFDTVEAMEAADAPGVNSSLRVAALALADLAERNTDDLDLWQALIAAVRNASDAPGVAVDEMQITKADFMKAVGIELMLMFADDSASAAKAYTAVSKVITALAPKPEGEL